ncbi:MAG: ribosome maturation factor RimM [Gammaproteobacteria bacterium]|nr:ribosome maturation factor RimM [Gammaproteobacteria bacterium]
MNNQIAIGRFGSPYGIKGWVKVISYTDPTEKILEYLPWYIFKDNNKTPIVKVNGKRHGNNLVIQIPQCKDRDEAKTYTNLEIYIDKEQLPAPEKDEYYWIDLVGLTVFNCEGENLGRVERLFDTGANDVLLVKDEQAKERLIPYIDHVIIKVDLENQKLTVDWDSSF